MIAMMNLKKLPGGDSKIKNMLRGNVYKLLNTGFFHIFGSSVLNKVLIFLSTLILVRIIPKSEYGIFTYAWNIYSIMVLLSGFGIVSGVMQICSENQSNPIKHLQVYQFGIKFGSMVDLGLAVLMAVLSLVIPLPIKGSYKVLLSLCLLPLVSLWGDLQTTFLRSQRRNKEYAWLSSTSTILYTVFTILGAYLFEAKGMILGRYVSAILFFTIAIYIYKIPFYKHKYAGIRKNDKKDILKVSLISMLNNGLSQMLYLIDVFVIGIVLTDSVQVASYKVATQIPNALSFIPIATVTYIYPYFAAHYNDKKWCFRRYKQVLITFGTLNICISFILIVSAPYIVKHLFGTQYLDAIPVFRILSLSYFFSGTFRVIGGNLLVTQRKLKFNTIVAVISGIVNVVADLLFINLWGAVGAALATISVVILTSIMNTIYFIKVLHSK